MPFEPGQSGNPAGRPKKAEKYAAPIAAAEERIADRLPEVLDNLFVLADGGYERVKEKWEPAALVVLELPLRKADGDPMVDTDGKPILAKQQVFPDAEPDQLVLVERTTETADRDRQANIYLVDRILGKPIAQVEGDLKVNHQLPPALEEMISKVYGDDGE